TVDSGRNHLRSPANLGGNGGRPTLYDYQV
ncbi:MAG TPA: DivIVA domain-containing protein, partial [Amycolatopsis sp.]